MTFNLKVSTRDGDISLSSQCQAYLGYLADQLNDQLPQSPPLKRSLLKRYHINNGTVRLLGGYEGFVYEYQKNVDIS
ncbi:hypothetical protein GCM10010917_12020 [Paenibacillus physcomitrellae]|uniref:Uncharacterized protein n=1 Tax=Paenibacillus physcomitrellae TaxID=1619311 RepID=A0ABQ1FSG7_9BACL|nr:hypothetical protein GCM10010917_12020 [Paenibacillus physcomitrellae]